MRYKELLKIISNTLLMDSTPIAKDYYIKEFETFKFEISEYGIKQKILDYKYWLKSCGIPDSKIIKILCLFPNLLLYSSTTTQNKFYDTYNKLISSSQRKINISFNDFIFNIAKTCPTLFLYGTDRLIETVNTTINLLKKESKRFTLVFEGNEIKTISDIAMFILSEPCILKDSIRPNFYYKAICYISENNPKKLVPMKYIASKLNQEKISQIKAYKCPFERNLQKALQKIK